MSSMTPTPEERAREVRAGRFSDWSTSGLAAQCRMQARENLDPEYSQFMVAVADRLTTLTPASDDATVERVARAIWLSQAPASASYDPPLSEQWDALEGDYRERAFTTARAALAALPPRPSDEPDMEALGDALFVLSDKLRASHFFEEKVNHDAYERVVQAYLSRAYSPSDDVAKLRDLLCLADELLMEAKGAFPLPGNPLRNAYIAIRAVTGVDHQYRKDRARAALADGENGNA